MAAPPATETIAAIATAPGTAGIGIIRLSGPEAFAIFQRIFVPRQPRTHFVSHTLYYGTLVAPNGQVLDEALAVRMAAPHTYTREDVVELHCHGSYLVVQQVLQTVFSLGARLAEQGEFTKRAFLNGRIDLTQAEAVLELLQARTPESAELAVHHLRGELFETLEAIRQELVRILAQVEVAIDFPEEDLEILDASPLLALLQTQVLAPLEQLLTQAGRGRILREGLKVVLAGQPNVGKSSLLNALLHEERALVTPIPGTTRDTIEEQISLHGLPLSLIDTAGLRASQDVAASLPLDPVEALGIERALAKLDSADFILLLVDAAAGVSKQDQDLHASICHRPHLVVLNKQDLTAAAQMQQARSHFPADKCIALSAKKRQGLDHLQQVLYEAIVGSTAQPGVHGGDEALRCAPNTRQVPILQRTLAACHNFAQALQNNAPVDLLAIELQAALACLGEITGITSPDDVLDVIFEQFCLGK